MKIDGWITLITILAILVKIGLSAPNTRRTK